MGSNNTKFNKKCGQIEDAKRISIDSAPLHCPICLAVFRKAPEVLPCGHSHCQDCLKRVESYAARDAMDNRIWEGQARTNMSIECSLCRARCPVNRLRIKNYAIEAIIESLSTISEAEDPTNEIIASKNLVIERLKQNERELECRVKEMEANVERTKRTALLMFGITAAYFLLRVVLSNIQSNIAI